VVLRLWKGAHSWILERTPENFFITREILIEKLSLLSSLVTYQISWRIQEWHKQCIFKFSQLTTAISLQLHSNSFLGGGGTGDGTWVLMHSTMELNPQPVHCTFKESKQSCYKWFFKKSISLHAMAWMCPPKVLLLETNSPTSYVKGTCSGACERLHDDNSSFLRKGWEIWVGTLLSVTMLWCSRKALTRCLPSRWLHHVGLPCSRPSVSNLHPYKLPSLRYFDTAQKRG
jgi:hypothetical protein